MQHPRIRHRAAPLAPDRIRSPGSNGFAFVPNQFLHGGFFAALGDDEALLYLLLVLAGDRRGMSYYHYDTLCGLLHWPVERYLAARNALIDKDLIAFDGTSFQVLELPRLGVHTAVPWTLRKVGSGNTPQPPAATVTQTHDSISTCPQADAYIASPRVAAGSDTDKTAGGVPSRLLSSLRFVNASTVEHGPATSATAPTQPPAVDEAQYSQR